MNEHAAEFPEHSFLTDLWQDIRTNKPDIGTFLKFNYFVWFDLYGLLYQLHNLSPSVNFLLATVDY